MVAYLCNNVHALLLTYSVDCIASAGLLIMHIHVTEEVSCGAKKKTSVGLSVFNSSMHVLLSNLEGNWIFVICLLVTVTRCADMDLWLLRVGIANKDIDDTNSTEHPMI